MTDIRPKDGLVPPVSAIPKMSGDAQHPTQEDSVVAADRKKRRQLLQEMLMQKRREAGEPGGEVDVEA